MSKQFYPADKPTNCRYCYYWKNRKAGCSLGKENCIYEGITPKEQLSECVGYPYGRVLLDNILELIVEVMCSKRKELRIASDDKPIEIVRSRLMKLDCEHIRYVLDCSKENTTKVRNIKQYLLATIYNAPTTMEGYYDALVRHDMANGFPERR